MTYVGQEVPSLTNTRLVAGRGQFVDDIVSVNEDEIREATRRLVLGGHVVAEPSGAVTSAAYFFHRGELPRANRIAAVVSGGNIDPAILRDWIG